MVQCLPMQGMCVRSLVGELRSHRPRGSLRASTRKAGEPKPEKSPRASTKTQHNQNFFKNFTYVLSSVQAYRCHSSYQRWWRCPTHSLRTKTSAPHHPRSQEGCGDSARLAPPPALPGAEGRQRTARADLPETRDGSPARVATRDRAEARPQDFFA